jgi:hypothetical protein
MWLTDRAITLSIVEHECWIYPSLRPEYGGWGPRFSFLKDGE